MNDYQQSLRQQEKELEEIMRRAERDFILGVLRRLAAMPETESRRALMKGWATVLESDRPAPPPDARTQVEVSEGIPRSPRAYITRTYKDVPRDIGPSRLVDLDEHPGEYALNDAELMLNGIAEQAVDGFPGCSITIRSGETVASLDVEQHFMGRHGHVRLGSDALTISVWKWDVRRGPQDEPDHFDVEDLDISIDEVVNAIQGRMGLEQKEKVHGLTGDRGPFVEDAQDLVRLQREHRIWKAPAEVERAIAHQRAQPKTLGRLALMDALQEILRMMGSEAGGRGDAEGGERTASGWERP